MLVGYFDLFVIFVVGVIVAALLERRPTAPAALAWWPWLIGGGLALCTAVGAYALKSALDNPPVIGRPVEAPPLEAAGEMALLSAHVVLGVGIVWLLALAAITFLAKEAPGTEPEPGGDAP